MLLASRFLAIVFVLSGALTVQAAGLSDCLRRVPSMGHDPATRDRARAACIHRFQKRIAFNTCLKAARGFEYSTNSENMRNLCLFELKTAPTVQQCASTARSMEYGSNRDDLIWGCLKRLSMTIKAKECRELARLMVFPYHLDRATSYCREEIQAARK
jgi:hypothetical protein